MRFLATLGAILAGVIAVSPSALARQTEASGPPIAKVSLLANLAAPVSGVSEMGGSGRSVPGRPAFPITDTASKAQYLKSLFAKASVDKAKPGKSFKVAVMFEVEDDHHVNAHKPLDLNLIPTDISIDPVPGLTIGKLLFPKGERETGPMPNQPLLIYRGKTKAIIPITVDTSIRADEIHLSGKLRYQACNDKTSICFFPTSAAWSLILPVAKAGETAQAINADLFRAEKTQDDSPRDAKTQPSSAGETGRDTEKSFTPDSEVRVTTVQEEHSLLGWLGLALLAGIVLNVTPCVLPVVSIKILSFVQQASESPGKLFKLGLAFSFGMLLVFNVLAGLATGVGLVWGQHFQSPTFTIVMATIVFAFGLSLFGVFTIGVPRAVGDLAAHAEGEGYAGSIAKGALATVMGTPCLGPFLGSVLVWSATQPPAMVFLIFNAIGIGMALPYILLTANPNWLRFVPKPGPWLETFKQAMGFLLMWTVVYLLYILQGQVGGLALVWTLVFLSGVSVACWVFGRRMTPNTTASGRVIIAIVSLAIIGASAWVSYGKGVYLNTPSAKSYQRHEGELPWVDFSWERLGQLTGTGKMVLLDVTANWCPNCQLNTHMVFNSQEIAEAVSQYGVVPMLADWTARDAEIGQLINKLAPGASIPLCAVFPANRPNEPIVMLGLITKQKVIDALRKGVRPTSVTSE